MSSFYPRRNLKEKKKSAFGVLSKMKMYSITLGYFRSREINISAPYNVSIISGVGCIIDYSDLHYLKIPVVVISYLLCYFTVVTF